MLGGCLSAASAACDVTVVEGRLAVKRGAKLGAEPCWSRAVRAGLAGEGRGCVPVLEHRSLVQFPGCSDFIHAAWWPVCVCLSLCGCVPDPAARDC